MMVGGDEEAFERVKPMLQDVGPKRDARRRRTARRCSMKIAINLSLAVQMLAFSEGVLLAEKGGIAARSRSRRCCTSVIASPMVKYRGPFVLEHAGRRLVRRAT